MNRLWISGIAAVLAVAALKTALVTQFLLPENRFDPVTISGLFALFTVLTALVAYVAFTRFKAFFDAQRRERLAAGGGDTASKEAVIERCRTDWGLSQAEVDVAVFAAKGFSNAEIAAMRGCALATVKSQLGSIYQKSGLETRYQLIAYVTDEVCEMAQDQGIPLDNAIAAAPTGAEPAARSKVLPFFGRDKAAKAPRNATAQMANSPAVAASR